MSSRKKVSFDFDGTLDRASVQRFAKQLLGAGVDVWVVTTRFSDARRLEEFGDNVNQELWKVIDFVGVPRDRVVFTNMEWKASYFKDHPDFMWHLDDNPTEVFEMRKCKTKCLMVLGGNWKGKCVKFLDAELEAFQPPTIPQINVQPPTIPQINDCLTGEVER